MRVQSDSGSVFIWIFVMIGLLGLLMTFMMQGTRTGGATISNEKAALAANEIISYATAVRNAVKTLQVNGCTDIQISFEQNGYPQNTVNPRSPADYSYHLFKPEGGGMTVLKIPEKWIDNDYPLVPGWFPFKGYIAFTGTDNIVNIGTTTYADITMSIPYLKKDICIEINRSANNGYVIANGSFYFLQYNGPFLPREAPAHMPTVPAPMICGDLCTDSLRVSEGLAGTDFSAP